MPGTFQQKIFAVRPPNPRAAPLAANPPRVAFGRIRGGGCPFLKRRDCGALAAVSSRPRFSAALKESVPKTPTPSRARDERTTAEEPLHGLCLINLACRRL